MRIRLIAGLASVIVLHASNPAAGQTNGCWTDGGCAARAPRCARGGRAAVLSSDARSAQACARGECAGRVARSTLVGTAAGAGLALGYVLIRCVPQAAAAEHPRCGGGVPVVLMGSGAVVGLVAGLISPRCKSHPTADPQG